MPSTARILVNCNRLGLSPKPGIVARYFALDKRLSLEPPHDSRGINLLHDPLWNKGTAFGISERERFGLRGLLPPRMLDMDDQIRLLKQLIVAAVRLGKIQFWNCPLKCSLL